MIQNKISYGLRFSWMNLLSKKARLKALELLTKTKFSTKPIDFSNSLSSFKNVLVILSENPHQILIAQKALIAIKEHRKDITLEVLAERSCKNLIKSNSFIDGGIFYNRQDFLYNNPSFCEMIEEIKGRKYDACFVFDTDADPLKLYTAATTNAPIKIGFSNINAYPFLNLQINQKNRHIYEGDAIESLLKSIGINILENKLQWQISPSTQKDAEMILLDSGYKSNHKLICIDLSKHFGKKPFSLEKTNTIIEALSELDKCEILVLTAPESEKSEDEPTLNTKHTVTIPSDNISLAAAFMQKCDLVIAANNLFYHLGVIFDKPALGLFSKKEASRWASVNNLHDYLTADKYQNIKAEDIIEKSKELFSKLK